jgi:hypothetical protein
VRKYKQIILKREEERKRAINGRKCGVKGLLWCNVKESKACLEYPE